MSPENKNLQQQTDLLNRLRDEIRGMDAEIMAEEASLGDFKRSSVRAWMGRKFGALLEACEKGAVSGSVELTFQGMARVMQRTKRGGRILWRVASLPL